MTDRAAGPETLSQSGFERLAGWLDAGEGLLLGLDFDGTLAPIVDDHTAATLPSETRRVLERLAARSGTALALVSGRELDDLASRVDIDGVVYAGNHGLEFAYDGGAVATPAGESLRPIIDRLCTALDHQIGDVPGCSIENKGVTATVHFRNTPETAVPRVLEAAERAAAGAPGIHVVDGKQVRELRPSVEWDKGRVMGLLRDSVPDTWRVMYVGDDTTDEDAFRAIQPEGVGIRVAPDRSGVDTAATYLLPDHSSVCDLLEWIDRNAPGGGEDGDAAWPVGDPLAHVSS